MKINIYATLLFLSMGWPTHVIFDAYKAQKCYKDNDLDKAYEHCVHNAFKSDGNDGFSLYNMGVIAYRKKDYETARDCFSRASEASSLSDIQRAQLHFNLGKTYEKLKRYEGAEEQFDKSLSYDPNNEHAQKAKEQAREHRAQEKENLADKPSKETEKQDQGKSDAHNQEQQDQRESDQSSHDDENKKNSTESNAQEQRNNKTEGGEEYADGCEHGSSQQPQEQSGFNDMCHNDTNTLKENNSTTAHISTNNNAEQKASMNAQLTETDKKVLAVVGEIDNKLQKELMKIALKQQPVRRGQKNW